MTVLYKVNWHYIVFEVAGECQISKFISGWYVV